jgi:arsenical pump membrane protein
MAHLAAVSILALTVGLSLTRPRLGRLRVTPPGAAVLGALLMLLTRLVTATGAFHALAFLVEPLLTIASLMVITLVAERAGLFRLAAHRMAVAARGDGRRLFRYIFLTGTVTGALFTNDAAVLIFTPMVYRLIEQAREESWSNEQKLPYYFAVLYVANLVAPLVIGNPINIVAASWLGIGFLEYAVWMFVPAVLSIVVTYFGIRLWFGRSIPATYRIPQADPEQPESRRLLFPAGVVLGTTLFAFFTQHLTGIHGSVFAAAGAVLLLALHVPARTSVRPILEGVGWDILVFVAGMFLVARGLANAGLTQALGEALAPASGVPTLGESLTTGLAAGISSAVMNNHPVADIMAVTIHGLGLDHVGTRMMAFSALIGGDLGPKMLPIGSLAALMWFRILRKRGVNVSYGQYIRLGVPVTLAAIVIAILALNLQLALVVG